MLTISSQTTKLAHSLRRRLLPSTDKSKRFVSIERNSFVATTRIFRAQTITQMRLRPALSGVVTNLGTVGGPLSLPSSPLPSLGSFRRQLKTFKTLCI